MIPKRIVSDLIELGVSGQSTVPASLRNQDWTWRILTGAFEPWKVLGQSLEKADVHALIKGLVLYSKAVGQSGGSVSPVIPLYRAFCERWPEDEPAITGWVVDNTENPYEPFGSAVHGGARSRAELSLYHARRAAAAMKNIEAEEERARVAKVARAGRATTKLFNAVRRGDLKAVKALIEMGANWREVVESRGSLLQLAVEKSREHVFEYLKSIGVE